MPARDGLYSLYHGDCLDVLRRMKDKSIEVVVTSPPYNLNKRHSGGGGSESMKSIMRRYQRWYDDDMDEGSY